jgi:branched-chain amino acid transport system substrate-binding protein
LNKITNVTRASNIQLLGGDALYGCNFLQAGREGVEGLVLVVPWFPLSEYQYAKDTNATFNPATGIGWEGPVTWRTAMSYDATQALIQALKLAKSKGEVNRQSILKNLSSVNLPATQTSGKPLKFINGERRSPPQLIQIVKGEIPGCKAPVQFKPIQ